MGNLLILLIGAALVLAALGPVGLFMVSLQPDNGRVVADFHTLFNAVMAVLFLPLLSPYGNLLGQLMPAFIKVTDPAGSAHRDQAGMPVTTEAHDRPMRPARRIGTDPGELLVGGRQHLRERDHVPVPGKDACRTDVLDRGDSGGGDRLASRDTIQDAEDERRDNARAGPQMRDTSTLRVRGDLAENGRRTVDGTTDRSVRMRYEPARSVWLTLQDLRIVRQAEPTGDEGQSVLATYIQGTAHLDDADLCVVGEPQTRQHAVSVTFAVRELNEGDHRGLREWQDELGIAFSDVPLGTARLGYNAADPEIQEPGRWWASFHVPASSMQGLIEGIDAARLTDVKLALSMRHLYSTALEAAITQGDPCVFLRPDSVNATGLPEVATGYVTHMAFEQARLRLCESDGICPRDDDTLPGGGGIQEAEAVRLLGEKVGSLVVLVKMACRTHCGAGCCFCSRKALSAGACRSSLPVMLQCRIRLMTGSSLRPEAGTGATHPESGAPVVSFTDCSQ